MNCATRSLHIDPFPALLQPSCAQCAGIGLQHSIPDMLWDLEDACGEAALFAFLLAYGGREYCSTVNAPEVREDDPLSLARNWVHRHIGRGKITIPLGPAAYRCHVAWTVYDRLSRGHSLAGFLTSCASTPARSACIAPA